MVSLLQPNLTNQFQPSILGEPYFIIIIAFVLKFEGIMNKIISDFKSNCFLG